MRLKQSTLPLTIIIAVMALTGSVLGQVSSLYQRNEQGYVPLATSSLTYREVPPPKKIQLRDHVTIVVIESAQSTNSGEFDGRKNATLDATLKNWLELDGLNLKPAPQPDGDPRVTGTLNNQYRAEGELQTRQALKFNITAEVVDIRPNGILVLEAYKRIENGEDVFEAWLTGMVRPEEIDPRNRVTSDALASPQIRVKPSGHVRDAYRRGWLHKLYDRFAPF